jgi:hypothetical protein
LRLVVGLPTQELRHDGNRPTAVAAYEEDILGSSDSRSGLLLLAFCRNVNAPNNIVLRAAARRA